MREGRWLEMNGEKKIPLLSPQMFDLFSNCVYKRGVHYRIFALIAKSILVNALVTPVVVKKKKKYPTKNRKQKF